MLIGYEELFDKVKKCKNNKEVNEVLDRFLEEVQEN